MIPELKLAIYAVEEKNKEKAKPMAWKDILSPTIDDDGTDWSLVTWKEWELLIQYSEIVRRRAVELTFLNEGQMVNELSRRERDAVINCLTTAEALALKRCVTVFDKNKRVREKLTKKEKEAIRLYNHVVYHFEAKSVFKNLDDIDVYLAVEDYFNLMRNHGEVLFEEPYYFVSNKRMDKIKQRGKEYVEHADICTSP